MHFPVQVGQNGHGVRVCGAAHWRARASKTNLGEEVTVFHDCKISELTLRQVRNTREADLAPFGLRMDVFRFDGSFCRS